MYDSVNKVFDIGLGVIGKIRDTQAEKIDAAGKLIAKTHTQKNATHIVIIIGMSTTRCKMPKMSAKEHTTSANITIQKEIVLPSPKGSAKRFAMEAWVTSLL